MLMVLVLFIINKTNTDKHYLYNVYVFLYSSSKLRQQPRPQECESRLRDPPEVAAAAVLSVVTSKLQKDSYPV